MIVTAINYLLEDFPGWVTFTFLDAHEQRWTVTEKLPVLGLDYPENEEDRNVPFDFMIETVELSSYFDSSGRKTSRIQFLYGIQTDDGQEQFEVFTDQLVSV